MKIPTKLLEKQKELLINILSSMFIHGTEPCIQYGTITYRWKKLNQSEKYVDGLLMLEFLNKQLIENRATAKIPDTNTLEEEG